MVANPEGDVLPTYSVMLSGEKEFFLDKIDSGLAVSYDKNCQEPPVKIIFNENFEIVELEE